MSKQQYQRKSRNSKLIGTRTVEGFIYTYFITEDLTDDELKQHIARAVTDEDFEYAEAVNAEAQRRGFRIIVEK